SPRTRPPPRPPLFPYTTLFRSPTGEFIASASWDMTIRLWEARTGKLVKTLGSHKAAVFSVAFSPDGKTLASAGAEGDAEHGRLRSEEHTSELQSRFDLVCRLLL